MPSIPKSTPQAAAFSYAGSEKKLRLGNVPVPDKLSTCETLLSRASTLTPPPFPLILDHVLYVLNPRLPSPAFKPHLAAYWALLLRTLEAASSHIFRLPSNLLRTAAAHLSTADEALVLAVAAALQHFTTAAHAPPAKLDEHAALLAALAAQLPRHASLQPLALRLLHAHTCLQARNRDPGKVFAAAAVLLRPLLAAPPRVRDAAQSMLAAALFTHPDIPRDPVLSVLREAKDARLPDVVEFVLRECAHVARKAHAARDSREKPTLRKDRGAGDTGLPVDVLRVLKFFDELMVVLSDAVREAAGPTAGDEKLGFSVRVTAVARLFQVAEELGLYRPSYEAQLQVWHAKRTSAAKRTKEGVQKGKMWWQDPPVNLGNRVKALFGDLVSLLRGMYEERQLPRDQVEPLSTAIAAMLSFSLDTVEDGVGALLEASVANVHLVDGLHSDIVSRRQVFCALVRTYKRTRSLPFLFRRITSSSLGFSMLRRSSGLLEDSTVQKTLAEAIENLPRGQPEQCIRELMAMKTTVSPADVPCLSFLVSLILEATNTSETKAVLDAIDETVLPRIIYLNSSVQTRSGSLFLLASILFAVLRANISTSSSEFQVTVIQGGLIQASGIPWQRNGDDENRNYEKNLFHALSKKIASLETTECFCVIRLLSVLAHSMAGKKAGEAQPLEVKKMIYVIFEVYERLLIAAGPETYWMGSSLFHGSSPCDAVVPIVGSVSQMLSYSATGEKLPTGFKTFLGYAAESFDGDDQIWEDLLEFGAVQNVLAEAMSARLSSLLREEKKCASTSEGSMCKCERVLKLIQSLPPAYLSEKDERELSKSVVSAIGSICCDRSRERALKVVTLLNGSSVSSLEAVLQESVSSGNNDDMLKQLVGRIRRGILNEGKGEELVAKVLRIWSERCNVLGLAQNMLRNVIGMLHHCALSLPIETKVVSGLMNLLPAMQRNSLAALSSGKVDDTVADSIAVIGTMLRLRSAVEEAMGNASEVPREITRLREVLDTFLTEVFEKSVSNAVSFVSESRAGGLGHRHFAASRDLLLAACQGSPAPYRLFQSEIESTFTISRMCALGLHFLKNSDLFVRTIGVDVICAIGSNEKTGVVRGLGMTISRELDDWSDIPQLTCGSTLNIEEGKKLLGRFELARSRVVAGTSLLCGIERGSDGSLVLHSGKNGMFAGFKEARKRRDLSHIPLDREVTGTLVIKLLQAAGVLLDAAGCLQNVNSHDRALNSVELKSMDSIAWDCTAFALQAAEIAVERRAPARLDSASVQDMLLELISLAQPTTPASAPDPPRLSDVHTQLARICKPLLHHHGGNVRWPVTRLLRALLRQRRVSTGAARAVGAAYGVLAERVGGGGRDLVRAALADVCDALARAEAGHVWRDVMPGVAKLLAAAGDDGAQAVMAALPGEAKTVLRQVRETYGRDFQYRGK